jgi:hypothetical protein
MTDRYIRLLAGVESYETGDGLLLTQAGRVLRVRGGRDSLREMVGQLRTGVSAPTFIRSYGRAAAQLTEELSAERWLTSEAPADEDDAVWQRQAGYLGAFGPDIRAQQRRLRTATVAIIGVGGVGGLVAQHLAGAGIGKLWLIDHDDVAMHNLNRQYLFGQPDIGTPKVVAAAAAIGRLSGDTDVVPSHRHVSAVPDLDNLPDCLDLLVVAADEPADLMDTVCSWAEARHVAVLRAAVGMETGWWGPLISTHHHSCWRHFERRRQGRLKAEERQWESSGVIPMRWSFGPTNAVVAGMLAHDGLQFLAVGDCPSLGRRAVLDFTRMAVKFVGDSRCEAGSDGWCALRNGSEHT